MLWQPFPQQSPCHHKPCLQDVAFISGCKGSALQLHQSGSPHFASTHSDVAIACQKTCPHSCLARGPRWQLLHLDCCRQSPSLHRAWLNAISGLLELLQRTAQAQAKSPQASAVRSCRVYDSLPITHAIPCTLQSVAAGHAAEQRRPHGGLFPQVPSHQVSGNSPELHIQFASCRAMPAVSDPAFSLPRPGTLVIATGLSTRSDRCVANPSLQESAQLPHLGGCWKAWSACQQRSLLPCTCLSAG